MKTLLLLRECVTCFLLAICLPPAHAQQISEGLIVEQQQKVDQYILDYIKVLRVKEPQPQPPAVAAFNEKYTEVCRKRAEAEYIPDVERAVELAVARISRHTGMFHGREGKGGNWSGYGTTAETMKGMCRLIGNMGVENMPHRHVRADTLVKNQEQMRKGDVSVKRNTAEMMVQCLLESPFAARNCSRHWTVTLR